MCRKAILAGALAMAIIGSMFWVGAVSVYADDVVVDFREFYEGDLAVDGFELNGKTRLTIDIVGAELKHSDDLYAYGWILDAASREPVWVLKEQDTQRFGKNKEVRQFSGEVTLPAGRYEVYYYAGQPYYYDNLEIKIDNLSEAIDLLQNLFDDSRDKEKYYSEDIGDFMMQIKAPTGSFSKFNPVEDLGRKAIVEFSRPGDDYFENKGFSLKKDMPVKIIAIGEYFSSDRVFVDYGWIINADTREKIWQMDKWNTSWAGGGRKNRAFIGQIDLPEGNYVASFVTDDSHSFGKWNVMPPYDPLHYGMVIYPANEGDLKSAADYVDNYSEPIIVQIARVRNDEYAYKGFTLKKESRLHIVALGEYGSLEEFVDYGWIENVDDNEVVWKMTGDNTEHAGGASKNRRFDGIITLEPGNYMVYYISDDSHAYRDWNSTAPYDQEMWGVTIYGAGRDFDEKAVTVFDELSTSSKRLVNLVGLGDDEDVRQTFELKKPGKVHIFALGEGKDNRMYDYGWIENARTGEIIWEMTYRKTRHAGGGSKNRMVDTYINLDAGTYNAYYVTDGSHSFPDFNTSRPDRPHMWGITISQE
nr:hypothetical protein [candidate division Zixibacteria bacterium]